MTAPGGVWVYGQDGRHLGRVDVPELVADLHWGGADWHTLFLAATTSLFAVDPRVGPRHEPFVSPRPRILQEAGPAAASPSVERKRAGSGASPIETGW